MRYTLINNNPNASILRGPKARTRVVLGSAPARVDRKVPLSPPPSPVLLKEDTLNLTVDEAISKSICTSNSTKKHFVYQKAYHCDDCGMNTEGYSICEVCINACHSGHSTSYWTQIEMFCDCVRFNITFFKNIFFFRLIQEIVLVFKEILTMNLRVVVVIVTVTLQDLLQEASVQEVEVQEEEV